MSTAIGRYRHRIEIQRSTWSQDPVTGEMTYSWETEAIVWAAVEPLQGREFFAAASIQSETTTRIRMRYRPGIDTAMRILFDGSIYNITSIIEPQKRRRELQLMCQSGVDDG